MTRRSEKLNNEPTEGQSNDFADGIVDELVPGDLDWQRMVRSYPVISMSVAGLAGFLLGRSQGSTLVAAVSAFAAQEMSRNVLSILDSDFMQPKSSGSSE